MKEINFDGLKESINPIYYEHGMFNNAPLQIYFGGSSSGKSHFLGQRAVLDVLSGRNYLIVRKVGNSLKRSVFNEIYSKISDLNLMQYFALNGTDLTVTCKLNNKQILLSGLDDVEKLKSTRPINGVLTDIWIEEATEITYDDFKQLDKRLRGLSNFTKRITLSFNPIIQSHWIYKTFFTDWTNESQWYEKEGLTILKTTYRDNLFLTEDDIQRLESETDAYYRRVYLDGDWGILKGAVFTDWEVSNFNINSFDQYRFGVDWGFASDPYAFVVSAIDKKHKIIYVCEEHCGVGLLNDKTIPVVKNKAGGNIVWCDSSEPKSITEYRAYGIRARAVKKGKGSVQEGINYMKRFKIIVHPSCKNTAQELQSYRYKVDKDGDILPEPIDRDNHCIDAIRYSLERDSSMKVSFAEIV